MSKDERSHHEQLHEVQAELDKMGPPPWTGSERERDELTRKYVELHREQAGIEARLRVIDSV